MIQRCTNPKCLSYKYYGACGITVCQRWRLSFADFIADMGPRPPGTSLDRYPDQNGDYKPGNVRWATRTEQARNRSDNKLTRELAETIIKRLTNKESQTLIAAQLGLSANHISKLWKGSIWTDLERPWCAEGVPVPRYVPLPSGRQGKPKKRGRHNRLTREVARKIIALLGRKKSQCSIAKQLRIRPKHVSAIWTGAIWSELKRPWLVDGRAPHFTRWKRKAA